MTISRSRWSIAAVAAIAVAAGGTIGCTSTDSTNAAQQPSATDTPGPFGHEMHEPPGPEMVLVAALHHLDLKPEQRTAIERALQTIGPRHSMDVFVEVAAEVRAGAVDENRVLAKLDAGAPDRAAAVASAINTLHATLAPEQRRALVDAIATRMAMHGAMHPPSAAPADLLERLVTRLGLTDDQRAAVERIVAAQQPASDAAASGNEAFHAALRARLDAFATDSFDAAAFAAPPKEMRGHIQRTLHTLAAILPVLNASQREALAKMIEAKAARGG